MRRFKDNILKDKNFIKEIIITLIVGIIINVVCFFMCSITGHCENLEYFPIVSGQNDNGLTINQEYINQRLNNGAIFIHAYPDTRNPEYTYYAIIYDLQSLDPEITPLLYAEIPSGTQQNFSLQFNVNSFQNTISFKADFVRDLNDGTTPSVRSTDNTTLAQFQNLLSSSYTGSKHVYYSTYNINRNSPNNSDDIILYSISNGINIGEFSDLPGIDEILNNISNSWEPPSSLTGHALPSSPTENPNNTPFQERKEFFDYIANTITQNFGNLGYNLANWFNGLQQKLTDGFNSVSQNVYNGFKTLMDNIKDFFGAKLDFIIEKINYITEPLDQEEINDFIESSDIFSDVSSFQTSVSNFTSSLTGVSEPNTYSITLHVENIGILHQEQPYILSFDILNNVKVYIRGFLWCFCTYGLFISIVDSFANYINGGGGEDD